MGGRQDVMPRGVDDRRDRARVGERRCGELFSCERTDRQLSAREGVDG